MSDDGPQAMGRRAFFGAAAAAAAATAASGSATAQDEVVEVEVDNYEYRPPGQGETLYIEPGTTVRFVWVTDNHDIAIESQPDDSAWEGVPEVHDTGYEHEFTFEVLGEYTFFCTPHVGLGMEATIEVTDDPPDDDREVAPAVPPEAMTLGIATAFALVATLGLAYVFLKYGGQPTDEE